MGNITNAKGRFQLKRDFQNNWENPKNSDQVKINPGELVGIYTEGEAINGQSSVKFSTNSTDDNVIYIEGNQVKINNNEIKVESAIGASISLTNKLNKEVILKNDTQTLITTIQPGSVYNLEVEAQPSSATLLTYYAYVEGKKYHSVSVKMGDSNNLIDEGNTYSETPYVANIKAGKGYGAIQQAGPNEEYGQANGAFSATFGNNTITNNDYEIAFGKYNQSNTNTIFSIGNGENEEERSNLLELDKDGKLIVANLVVGQQELNADTIGDLIQNSGGGILIVPFEKEEDPYVRPTLDSAITDIQEALIKGKGIVAVLDDEYYNLYQYSLSEVDELPTIIFTCSIGNKNKQISYMENSWEIAEIEIVEAIDWEGNDESLSLKAAEYANNAYKAIEDANGNNIINTYATISNVNKLNNSVEELEGSIEDLESSIEDLSSSVSGLSQNLTSHIGTIGTNTEKGHLKLSDSYSSNSDISDGIAATPKAVKVAYDKAQETYNELNESKAPAHEFGTTIPNELSYGTLFIQI